MLEPGTRIEMTKGYRGVKGVINEITDSDYEFYVVALDNGTSIGVGTAVMFLVLLVAIIVVALVVGRRRTGGRGNITEEEADEIFSKDMPEEPDGTGDTGGVGDADGGADGTGDVPGRD